MSDSAIQLTDEQLARFRADGFLVIENLLSADLAARVADRIDPLFHGQFETGIYPDEWHWRPGMSLPDITREICNGWKSDLTLASVALSSEIGRLTATLAGWNGARIGQDSVWMKPPGAKEVAFHQDGTYISVYVTPAETLTCWIALDDVTADIGTIEYARGSHRWGAQTQLGEFHAPDADYRAAMYQAAQAAGVEPEIVPIEISAGSCVIHDGNTWHGSGKNRRSDRPRLSLAIHTLSADAQFKPARAGYIYGRYQRAGDPTLDEQFFPILWTKAGYRSPHLVDYCEDALTVTKQLTALTA
jgi:phytanoyl-CoA hydroxylase